MVDLEDINRHLLAAPHYYCMELHGLFALCWCVLSGLAKLAAGIMGRYGAELMRRSKQWRQAVGDGWNGVGRFWRGFRRKPTEVWWRKERSKG